MADCRSCGAPGLLWAEVEGETDSLGRPKRIALEPAAQTTGPNRYQVRYGAEGTGEVPKATRVNDSFPGEAFPDHHTRCIVLTSAGRV